MQHIVRLRPRRKPLPSASSAQLDAAIGAMIRAEAPYRALAADCLRVMARMPDKSVDLVFGSPPYENRRYYGELDFKLKGEAWVSWFLPIVRECCRVSRGLVAFVVQGKTHKHQWSATPALVLADLHRMGFAVRNPPIFYRHGIAGSGAKDWLRSDYEWVITVQETAGPLPYADNLACGHPPRWAPGGAFSHRQSSGKRVNQWGGSKGAGNSRRENGQRQEAGRPSHKVTTKAEAIANGHPVNGKNKTTKRKPHGRKQEQVYIPPAIANPGNVIKAMYSAEDVAAILAHNGCAGYGDVLRTLVGGGQMGDDHAHESEAPFPLALPDFFIRSFCPPGGLVFDPFLGSGTTIHAALLAGRIGLGCDVRVSQVRLARRRLRKVDPAGFEEELRALAIFDEGKEHPPKVRRAAALREQDRRPAL